MCGRRLVTGGAPVLDHEMQKRQIVTGTRVDIATVRAILASAASTA
jgi:hypothetical protein